jgi:hypothetical protein
MKRTRHTPEQVIRKLRDAARDTTPSPSARTSTVTLRPSRCTFKVTRKPEFRNRHPKNACLIGRFSAAAPASAGAPTLPQDPG